ncbi:sulfatase [Echinicola sp. 20G]|uniref:sulfatase family protein n=1 Tax=Echinicola sp. 20G TaxID=2781961 RepID=UPI001910109D|nr:sulfatase [Echinicola sp. 20G]
MNSFFRRIVLILFIVTISFLEAYSQSRPNIVWITSEDNSKHYLSLFDSNGISTPNIERLAATGLVFDHAFSNAPVCSVARSTLISGCYAPRVGVQFHRKLQKVPLPNGLKMFPTYLREAGYYTTNNAKEDYNFIKNDGVWDESSNKASYKNRKEGQPFFHVFNIAITHEGSLHFDENIMDKTPLDELPEPGRLQPNHPQTELFKYTRARYLSKIQDMDKKVGEVINELEKDGLLENTFIFYFGDHGGVMPGSKGYLYETGLHVPLVIHIPEKYADLVSYPQGSRVTDFVSFVDFAPTVLKLAGLELPEHMDGKPFLNKKSTPTRQQTFGYADRFDEKYDLVRSLRSGKYKYIRNYQPFNFDGLMNNYRYQQKAYEEWWDLYRGGKLDKTQASFFKSRPAEMLFDVKQDPFETNNLAQDPAYRKILLSLRQDLREWETSMPDLSFYPEFYLINSAFNDPVEFGKSHKKVIQQYIKIADWSLEDYDEVKNSISKTLDSSDPWERYWALIVASSFGQEAKEMQVTIKSIALNDPEKINRVRAAEFLGLLKLENPAPIMLQALYNSSDGNEALLILNSIALMQDGSGKYAFDIDTNKIHDEVKSNEEVKRRLLYLVDQN